MSYETDIAGIKQDIQTLFGTLQQQLRLILIDLDNLQKKIDGDSKNAVVVQESK